MYFYKLPLAEFVIVLFAFTSLTFIEKEVLMADIQQDIKSQGAYRNFYKKTYVKKKELHSTRSYKNGQLPSYFLIAHSSDDSNFDTHRRYSSKYGSSYGSQRESDYTVGSTGTAVTDVANTFVLPETVGDHLTDLIHKNEGKSETRGLSILYS